METGDTIPNAQQYISEDLSGYDINFTLNEIHPTAVIGKNVRLGKGNYVGSFCVIEGNTIIGNNNRFESHSCIGSEPEHKEYFGQPNKGVIIGNNNVFREFTTVNAGCEKPTILENNIVMLRGSHIGHDSTIKSGCTISCNVLVGGHSLLGFGVNMGLGSICHQYSKIGSFSMVGMGAIVTKKTNVVCFGKFVGNPAKSIGNNDYQIQKFSVELMNDVFVEFEKMITEFSDEPTI